MYFVRCLSEIEPASFHEVVSFLMNSVGPDIGCLPHTLRGNGNDESSFILVFIVVAQMRTPLIST